MNNVKRRAYDALTVLVAVGVIEKQGKEIKINPKCTFPLGIKIKDTLTSKTILIFNKCNVFS